MADGHGHELRVSAPLKLSLWTFNVQQQQQEQNWNCSSWSDLSGREVWTLWVAPILSWSNQLWNWVILGSEERFRWHRGLIALLTPPLIQICIGLLRFCFVFYRILKLKNQFYCICFPFCSLSTFRGAKSNDNNRKKDDRIMNKEHQKDAMNIS